MEKIRQVRVSQKIYVAAKDLQLRLLEKGIEVKSPDVLDALIEYSLLKISDLDTEAKWRFLKEKSDVTEEKQQKIELK